jgi:Cu/Ag efflux protein CusF
MFRLPTIRLGVAMLFLVVLATTVSAEEAKGTIRSISADKAEVVVKGIVSDTTYELNKDARLCLDGKKAKIGDLQEGDRVTVEFDKTKQGHLKASEVRALRKATETTGTVRSADAQKNQLTLKGIVKDTTYNLEKSTVVLINGKEGKVADLREGDQVRITYEQRGDQLMASEVCMHKK